MNKKSHEIFADFYTDVPTGGKRMALAHGVHNDTAVAWSRPKASDVNPTATGKNNPVDAVRRTIAVIHPHDPVRAREIVTHLDQFCDDLDREAGLIEADEVAHPCAAVARVVENQMQLILSTLGSCGDGDPEKLADTLAKTQGLKSSVIQLESCLKRLLKKNNDEKPKRRKGITR